MKLTSLTSNGSSRVVGAAACQDELEVEGSIPAGAGVKLLFFLLLSSGKLRVLISTPFGRLLSTCDVKVEEKIPSSTTSFIKHRMGSNRVTS